VQYPQVADDMSIMPCRMSSSSSSIADDGAMLMKLEPPLLLPPLLAVEAVAMLGQQEWGEDEEEG